MIMLAGALVLLLAAACAGGDLRRLGSISLTHLWLLPVTLVMQVVAFVALSQADGPWTALLHVGSYVLVGAFVILNRAIPGLVLMGLGATMNGVTIALNGGTLPASAQARASAGFITVPGLTVNSGIVDDPTLAFLGDNFSIPRGWPFANTFSVGDVVLLLGFALCVLTVTRRSPAPQPASSAARPAQVLPAIPVPVPSTGIGVQAAEESQEQRPPRVLAPGTVLPGQRARSRGGSRSPARQTVR